MAYSMLSPAPVLWWAKRSIEQTDISRTLNRIRSAPGVAAANVQKGDDGWQLFVAADPVAQIEPIIQEGLTARSKISLFIDPILSLDPTSTARALEASLPPAAGVQLVVSRKVVHVFGNASSEYLESLRRHPRVQLANLSVVAQTGAKTPVVSN